MSDAAIRPPHGELAATGFNLPNLAIAAATGVRAGEEILHWMLAAAAYTRENGFHSIGKLTRECLVQRIDLESQSVRDSEA
jgi:hypothetical protein